MYAKLIIISLLSIILFFNGCTNQTMDSTIHVKQVSNIKKDAKTIAIEGFNNLKKKDFKNAKIKLEIADKLGHIDAPRALGLMYTNGDGVIKNYQTALHYYQKAYKRGNYVAAYDIGVMYRNSEGTKKNISKAKHYYLIAAKKNYGLAQYELAKIYGLEHNKKEFMYWAKKAQTHGYYFK